MQRTNFKNFLRTYFVAIIVGYHYKKSVRCEDSNLAIN